MLFILAAFVIVGDRTYYGEIPATLALTVNVIFQRILCPRSAWLLRIYASLVYK